MSEPIRVLHVFHEMSNGGIEKFVMDYYRHIDRKIVQFDFLVSVETNGYYDDEIKKLGGKIFRAYPKSKNIIRNLLDIRKIVKENNYRIVHRHTGSAFAKIDLFAAKLGGADKLICHSHNNSAGNLPIHYLCKYLVPVNTINLACSEDAGKWLFGKKGDFIIINNAIDCSEFKYDERKRDILRKRLQLEDEFIIGHVGRFEEQKNHIFLFEIMNELVKFDNSIKLLCIGSGSLLEQMKDRVNKLGLDGNVLFLGDRQDVNEIYQAFDLFLLPSLYEGFPFVLVEAQTSGLISVVSDKVPKECNLTKKISFLSLDDSAVDWSKSIYKLLTKISKNERKNDWISIRKCGYDISQESSKLLDYYLSLFNEVNL